MSRTRHPSSPSHASGILFALIAAVLFGLTMPWLKLRFAHVHFIVMAALVDLGMCIAAALLSRFAIDPRPLLTPANRPRFATSAIAGGLLSPILIVWGADHATGSEASLLLNLESAFTSLVAWAIFRDRIGHWLWLGTAMVTAGGILVSAGTATNSASGTSTTPWAAIALAGCCLGWAAENNSISRMTAVTPAQVTFWRAALSAVLLLAFSVTTHLPFPPLPVIAEAIAMGALCSGVALMAFVAALTILGASTATAYFSVAPFVGAALSILLLHDPLTLPITIGAAAMAVGVAALTLDLKRKQIENQSH